MNTTKNRMADSGRFERLARVIARRADVRVIPTAGACDTNCRDIIRLPVEADFLGDDQAATLAGLIDHESAHVRCRNIDKDRRAAGLDEIMRKAKDKATRMMVNVVADARDEQKMIMLYPGCRHNFQNAHDAAAKNRAAKPDGTTNLFHDIGCVIYSVLRGLDSTAWGAKANAIVAAHLTDEVAAAQATVDSFAPPRDVLKVAEGLVAKLRDLAEPPEDGADGDLPGDAADDSEGDGEKGDGKGKAKDPKDADTDAADDTDGGDSAGDEADDADTDGGEGDDDADADDGEGQGGEGDDADDDQDGDGTKGDPCDDGDDGDTDGDTDGDDGDTDGDTDTDDTDADGGDSAGGDGDGGDDAASPTDGDDDGSAKDPKDGEDPYDWQDDDEWREGEGGDASDHVDRKGGGDADGAADGSTDTADGVEDADPDETGGLDQELRDEIDEALDDEDGISEDPMHDEARAELADACEKVRGRFHIPHPRAAEQDGWTDTFHHYAREHCCSVEKAKEQGKSNYETERKNGGSEIGSLRAKLFRALKTRQAPKRRVGREDGQSLHAGSLYKLRVGDGRVFQRLEKGEAIDTAVQILIDQSGSMGGNKISVARRAAIALGETLHALNIPFEIIGWNTVAPTSQIRKGGADFNRVWRQEYLPHKLWTQGWDRDAKARVGAMAAGHHNVDSEAVEFAATRLAGRRESRKILLVLSDGHPCCCGTDTALDGRNITRVVRRAFDAGIEVLGIGILSDAPAHYYPVHDRVDNLRDLSKKVVKTIDQLLRGGKRIDARAGALK